MMTDISKSIIDQCDGSADAKQIELPPFQGVMS